MTATIVEIEHYTMSEVNLIQLDNGSTVSRKTRPPSPHCSVLRALLGAPRVSTGGRSRWLRYLTDLVHATTRQYSSPASPKFQLPWNWQMSAGISILGSAHHR